MAEVTKIEWADSTWNPWIGCTKVSPGCDHCYAERDQDTFRGRVKWGAGQDRVRTSPGNWALPPRWNRRPFGMCRSCGHRDWLDKQCPTCLLPLAPARMRVFCASLADVFDNEVEDLWRAALWDLIEATPNLDWLLLTKRIGNVRGMANRWMDAWPANVWLGASIVNQEEADRDIPKLLATPAAIRFLSMEPLLGPVNLTSIPIGGHGHHEFDPIITANVLKRAAGYPPLPQVDWVIVGGESGPKARPMNPMWVRELRDECDAAGVPYLLKQWGEWAPAAEGALQPSTVGGMARVGKVAAGRMLDGRTHDGVPEAAA